MTASEDVVRRFWAQVIGQWDIAAARRMLSDGFSWRGSLGSESTGIDEFLDYAASAKEAMPDLEVMIEELTVAETKVWTRLTFQATHHGRLLGVPGTGRRVAYVGQAVHDVSDGMLSRVWVVADTLSLQRQLVEGG